MGGAGCRELKSLLYGLTTADAQTILIASAGMMAVGLLATVIPARRASRIDPIQALRFE
jgi:putative ABC transport system permease protein